MSLTDSDAVIALWWIALLLTIVVIVPVALYLLHRTWRSADMIRRYSAETLAAAAGIASHTANIPALDATVEGAGPIAETAHRLNAASGELARVLRERAG